MLKFTAETSSKLFPPINTSRLIKSHTKHIRKTPLGGGCISCTRRGFQSPTEATGMSPNTRMKIKMHLERHLSKNV
jgi:hypothetical protein